MAVTELERLVVVETKLDALIKVQADMSGKMDTLLSNYVPRSEHEKDLAELRLDIEKARARSTLQVWLTGTFAALFGVIMTILVQSYFSH